METITSSSKKKPSRSRMGRPSKEESQRRHEELLDKSLDIFLERGFEQTTITDIAAMVGMSKRTVYTLYENKDSLFKAAVERAIDRYTIPLEKLRSLETESLEETLLAIARLRIVNLSDPTSLKLQRILNGQSFRFPELFSSAYDVKGTGPTVSFLCDLFERHKALGTIEIDDPQRSALAFLSLALSRPARMLVSGRFISQEDIEEQIQFSVRFFLRGVSPSCPHCGC